MPDKKYTTEIVNDILFFRDIDSKGIPLNSMSRIQQRAEHHYITLGYSKDNLRNLRLDTHLSALFNSIFVIGSTDKLSKFLKSPEYLHQKETVSQDFIDSGVEPDVARFITGTSLGKSSAQMLICAGLIDAENPVFDRQPGYRKMFTIDVTSAPLDGPDRKRCLTLLTELKSLIPDPIALIHRMMSLHPQNRGKWALLLEDLEKVPEADLT